MSRAQAEIHTAKPLAKRWARTAQRAAPNHRFEANVMVRGMAFYAAALRYEIAPGRLGADAAGPVAAAPH